MLRLFRLDFYSFTEVDHSRGSSQTATHTPAHSKQSRKVWWARRDSNPGPRDYESPALTAELRAHIQGNWHSKLKNTRVFFISSRNPGAP